MQCNAVNEGEVIDNSMNEVDSNSKLEMKV